MSARDVITDRSLKFMTGLHRGVLRASRGRALNKVLGMTTVELHTVGRSSGLRRSTMLTTPIHDDRRVVLVASKGGDDRHPDWYRNLVADPAVEITMGGTTTPMRARTASPEEKAALWPQILAVYKGYGGYQRRTERDIPVIICER